MIRPEIVNRKDRREVDLSRDSRAGLDDERRFGIEPELVARLAQAGARIYEVPISYSGRTYAEGKKIGWRDGVAAFWHILRCNLAPPRAPAYRPAHAAPAAPAPAAAPVAEQAGMARLHTN